MQCRHTVDMQTSTKKLVTVDVSSATVAGVFVHVADLSETSFTTAANFIVICFALLTDKHFWDECVFHMGQSRWLIAFPNEHSDAEKIPNSPPKLPNLVRAQMPWSLQLIRASLGLKTTSGAGMTDVYMSCGSEWPVWAQADTVLCPLRTRRG